MNTPDVKEVVRLAKRLVLVLLSRWAAGRQLTVLEDDVLLVSYPKSGNTWTRFLVANLLRPDGAVDFTNIEQIIPGIYKFTDKQLLGYPRPRVLKSHEYFDPRYRKAILIVRDPRDVLVSYYHHQVKFNAIPVDYPIARFADDFLAGRVDPFGSWAQNTGSWLGGSEGGTRLLVLRYEDMLADTEAALARIAAFLGLEAGPARLREVAAASSAERMRELEKAQAGQWTGTHKSRQDRPFVRSARSGGWREALPPEVVARLEREWGPLMQRLGYGPGQEA